MSSPSFQIKVDLKDTAAVLTLTGKITIGSGDIALRDKINELLAQGVKHFVLDVTGVVRMDSAGVGELVSIYTRITSNSGKLVLVGLPSSVTDILKVTGFISVFEAFDDLPTALDHVTA